MDQMFTQLLYSFIISAAVIFVCIKLKINWVLTFSAVSIMYLITSLGWLPRLSLLAGLYIIWSLQLTYRLRDKPDPGSWMSKTLRVVFLSLPLLFVGMNRSELIQWYEFVAISLWTFAIFGTWKASGKILLFSKWLIWFAFFVFALGSPLGWISAVTPILMGVILLRQT